MSIKTTAQGCQVTTNFGKTSRQLYDLPAGTEIEHVILECKPGVDLKLVKPDRSRNWDWNS